MVLQANIRKAQQGDVEAFNQLVLAYQDHVYTAAYRIMGDAAAADDMTQDAFVTAFRKLGQFHGGNFKAWLIRIAINTCYDELRRTKRRPTESINNDDYDSEANPKLVSKADSPETYVQRSELRSAIEDCFELLSAEHRLVVTMSDMEDYSYEEIASAVNISLGTVKSRISRARMRLRDCLKTKGELLPSVYRQDNVS